MAAKKQEKTREPSDSERLEAAISQLGKKDPNGVKKIERLPKERKQAFLAGFKQFDVDGGHTLDKDELQKVVEAVGQKTDPEQIEKILKENDADGGGSVDEAEFLLFMCQQLAAQDTEEEMKESFKVFDREGKGYIDLENLRKVFGDLNEGGRDGGLTDEDYQAMLDDTDLHDHEGEVPDSAEGKGKAKRPGTKITWNAFKKMMESKDVVDNEDGEEVDVSADDSEEEEKEGE